MSLPGVQLLNLFVIAIGIIVMFNILPETENRSLEDIEIHFSDKTKKITNYRIERLDSYYKNNNESKPNAISMNQAPTLAPPVPPPPKITSQEINSNELTAHFKQTGCDNRGFINDK